MNLSKSLFKLSKTYLNKLLEEWAARILIFGLLLVLCATLFPFNFSFKAVVSAQEIAANFKDYPSCLSDILSPSSLGDLLVNTCLFLPFGFGFAQILLKKSKRTLVFIFISVLFASFSLSATVELMQAFLPSRSPQTSDILTNSISGLLGFLCLKLCRKVLNNPSKILKKVSSYFSLKKLTFAFVSYLILTFLILTVFQNATNLSNWNPTFPLVLGNEQTGDRPWQGYIFEFSIANRAISEEEVERVFSEKESRSVLGNSLLASYNLTDGDIYRDRVGNLPNLSWQGQVRDTQAKLGTLLTPDSWLQTKTAATFITQRIRKTSEFTINTIIATGSTLQNGPARIVSLSGNSTQRNFTLAQEDSNLVFRLRTPFTGENGVNPKIVFQNCFEDIQPHHLVVTYKNSIVCIYVDKLQNSSFLGLFPGAKLFFRRY